MIEVYLFVHPLSQTSYQVEKKLLELIKINNQPINLQILPLVNLSTNTMALQQLDPELANNELHICMSAHSIALDFKAAQLQGKRYARHLLIQLQEALLQQRLSYSTELVEQLFSQTGGDLATFKEDRCSPLVNDLFWKDQQTAREFNITSYNAIVIYDFNQDEDGVLFTEDKLLPILDTFEDYLTTPKPSFRLYH